MLTLVSYQRAAPSPSSSLPHQVALALDPAAAPWSTSRLLSPSPLAELLHCRPPLCRSPPSFLQAMAEYLAMEGVPPTLHLPRSLSFLSPPLSRPPSAASLPRSLRWSRSQAPLLLAADPDLTVVALTAVALTAMVVVQARTVEVRTAEARTAEAPAEMAAALAQSHPPLPPCRP